MSAGPSGSDSQPDCDPPVVFFRLSSWELWLILAAVVFAFVGRRLRVGRVLRKHSESLREPVGTCRERCWRWSG